MRKWILSVLTVAVVSACGFAADDPKAVVEKAIKAHGGKDLLAKYPCNKAIAKGEMSLMGLDLNFEAVTTMAPEKFKLELSMSVGGMDVKVLQIVNGDKVISKTKVGDMNMDAISEAQKEELKMSVIEHEMGLIYPLLDAKKFTLKAEADDEVEGKKTAVISVTHTKSPDPTKLYFDKETGLMIKTSRKGLAPGSDDGTKVLYESIQSDYKKVDGLMIPMKLVVSTDGKKFMTIVTSEHTNLEKVDPKEFSVDD
jgi:hypothetical protein